MVISLLFLSGTTDIDECSDSVLLLQGIQACAPDFQCFNTLGDHECICPAGTVLGFTGPVEDTNAFCSGRHNFQASGLVYLRGWNLINFIATF